MSKLRLSDDTSPVGQEKNQDWESCWNSSNGLCSGGTGQETSSSMPIS